MKVISVISAPTPALYAIEDSEVHHIGERFLSKHIPNYTALNDRARRKAVNKLLCDSDVVLQVEAPEFPPNAPHKIEDVQGQKHWPSAAELADGVRSFLRLTELFSSASTGYFTVTYILAGLHSSAVRKEEPNIRFSITVADQSPIISKIFQTIVNIVVQRSRWKGKHCVLKRQAVLDCRHRSLTGVHIQDYSELRARWSERVTFGDPAPQTIKLSVPAAYTDTTAVIIGADSAFLREANPYFEGCTTFLVGCGSSDWGSARLTSGDVSSYDPDILGQLKACSSEIASVLRLWWEHDGDEIEDEDVWAQEIVADAKASFGRPDSRYIAVTLDPRKLRDAVAYRFFLSFLDFCVRRGLLTEEESAPYRTGAEAVFDPKPVPDKPLRCMEQPEVFREIMETLVKEYSYKIIPLGQPFVKAAKSFGAYREISGEPFLIMLEADWARAYLKAARKAGVDVSFAQHPNWERELQKLLCEAEAIKSPSAGFRYRYDLFGNGTRDKTYVVAYPLMS